MRVVLKRIRFLVLVPVLDQTLLLTSVQLEEEIEEMKCNLTKGQTLELSITVMIRKGDQKETIEPQIHVVLHEQEKRRGKGWGTCVRE